MTVWPDNWRRSLAANVEEVHQAVNTATLFQGDCQCGNDDGNPSCNVSESSGGRSSFRIMHRNDVRGGQSGGPYFGWWSGENFPRVIASQSAENWGMAGGPNAAGGGAPLPELIIHATTVEP